MKNTNKKGFTIVELVIVIAIVAVLAAILIPTFASLIRKANVSVDMQIVTQMNKVLAAEEIVSGKPATVVQAKEILTANGCDDFTPSEVRNVYYWVGSENRVILWEKDEGEDVTTGKVTYPNEYVEKYAGVTEPSADWADLSGDYDVILVEAAEGETLGEALINAVANAESGAVLKLPKNSIVELALQELGNALVMDGDVGKSLTLDLNGSTLKGTSQYALGIPVSGELVLINGAIQQYNMPGASKASVTIDTGARLIMRNVDITTNGCAVFPEGDASEVVIDGGSIQGASFAVATNNLSSDNIHIAISNANISAYNNADGFTGVMINVPGLLEIDNCNIVGDYQGIIVRGSTAVIKNSNVTLTEESWIPHGITDYFANINWGEGNTVNLAAITIGNKHPTSYQTSSNVTLINSTFTGINEWHAMYVYANSGEGLGVTLTYDDNCVFNGDIEYGNSGANITVNGSSVPIN